MSIREATFPKGSPRRHRVSTQIGDPLASKPERFCSLGAFAHSADSDAIGGERTRCARQFVRRARSRKNSSDSPPSMMRWSLEFGMPRAPLGARIHSAAHSSAQRLTIHLDVADCRRITPMLAFRNSRDQTPWLNGQRMFKLIGRDAVCLRGWTLR